MARRGGLGRRSAAAWGVRAVLAVVAAGVGFASVAQTFAYAIRNRDPVRAHALAPGDGRITALLADQTLGVEPDPAQRARAERLGALALTQNATAVPAVVVLGLAAELRADRGAARRLFGYSQRLSRRDLRTQVWAIENDVARGDVPGVIEHYDIALRTSRNAPDLLFPVLAAAGAEPAVARALTARLAMRPAWGGNFIDYVAGSGPDPLGTGRLLSMLHAAGVPVSGAARAVMVTRLISHDALDAAWSYYAATHAGGSDRRRSRDPQFAADPADPTPFDWIPVNDDGITASIQRGETGGTFDFAAPSSVGGTVLRQAQMLPAGDYVLDGHSTGIDQPADARPYWVLTCRDGREIGRVAVPGSAQAGGIFTGRLRVPAGCPLQLLALVARPSDSVAGVSGQIDRLRLRPVA